MYLYKKLLVLIIFLAVSLLNGYGQDSTTRTVELNQVIDDLEQKGVVLSQKVSISIDGSLQEMAALLTEASGINISVHPNINSPVSINFNEVPFKDILLYLCDIYQLDIKNSGSIVQLIRYTPPAKPANSIDITFDELTKSLSLNLNNDSLGIVIRKITELTGTNIVVEPSIRYQLISAFIDQSSTEETLKQLALNNNLLLTEESGVPMFKPQPTKGNSNNNGNNRPINNQLLIKKNGTDFIDVNVIDAPILSIIKQAAAQLETNYVILPNRATSLNNRQGGNFRQDQNFGNTINTSDDILSIQLEKVTFEELLDYVCVNSTYAYNMSNNVAVIGKRNAEQISDVRLVRMQNRSIKGVSSYIPAELQNGVTIDTLMEQNTFILSGSENRLIEMEAFLNSIDKVVPLVMIELIIVDVQKNMLREIGIEAGTVKGGVESGGNIASDGGVDFTFDAGAVNDLLDVLAGRNIINLGQVSPNFYVNLKALEEQGVVEVTSTPRLATLNSHMANMSIGQTRYYQEQQLSFPGTDRPIPVQSNVFQSIEANLDIEILPIVSGGDQVTLEVYFEQSEFIGEPPPNAPPAQVSRKFESIIRVKNEEMVVLGGLERESKFNLRRGIPYLSRIPVLGWLFGRKRKSKSNEKLLIFVRPIIIQ